MNLRSRTISCLMTLAFLVTGISSAQAYSHGPLNGMTDAPGESNCTICHADNPLNGGLGGLSVSGIPGSYTAGEQYDLVLELQDPSAVRWGFEFTILDGNNESAGSLMPLDGNTQTSSLDLRTYAKHTTAGTQSGQTDSASWTMRWTAPAAGTGDLMLYATGNAADGQGSLGGDWIYSTVVTWQENATSAAPVAVAPARLLPNYPNPFNPQTIIAFELDAAGPVDLVVYSMDGRLVRHLVGEVRSAGRHEILWNSLDENGRAVSSGNYFYRLRSGDIQETRTMALVR